MWFQIHIKKVVNIQTIWSKDAVMKSCSLHDIFYFPEHINIIKMQTTKTVNDFYGNF